jgi:transposase InsO family protein
VAREPHKRCERAQRDDALVPEIERVWKANLQVYGADKVWRQLAREGTVVARCTVERLMRRLGIRGVMRGKVVRTTTGDSTTPCPLDRVNRQFKAQRPNQLWVSDFSVPQQSGVRDEGRSLAIGLQEQVANHHERLGSKAPVVSVMEKVPGRHQVWVNEDEQP